MIRMISLTVRGASAVLCAACRPPRAVGPLLFLSQVQAGLCSLPSLTHAHPRSTARTTHTHTSAVRTHALAHCTAAGQLAGLQAYAYSSLREKRADDARAQIAAGERAAL